MNPNIPDLTDPKPHSSIDNNIDHIPTQIDLDKPSVDTAMPEQAKTDIPAPSHEPRVPRTSTRVRNSVDRLKYDKLGSNS